MQNNSINVCVICKKEFISATENTSHVCDKYTTLKEPSCETKQELQQYTTCNKSFSFPSELNHYELIHLNKRYGCDICNKAFKNKKNVKNHKVRMHTEKHFKCKSCNKSFALPHHLKRHELIHLNEERYDCDICKKMFKTKDAVRTHITNIHTEKRYKCNICNKSFSLSSHLKHHELIHFRERYECDKCKQSFKSKKAVRVHIIYTHKKTRSKCNTCHETWFGSERDLKQHKALHVINITYPCYKCDKRFTTIYGLRYHSKRAHEERRIICTTCHKRFAFKRDLRKHEVSHLNEINEILYECDICEKTFKDKDAIGMHKITEHKEKRK